MSSLKQILFNLSRGKCVNLLCEMQQSCIPTNLYSRLFDCDSFTSKQNKIYMPVSSVIVTQLEIKHVRYFKPGEWLDVTHGDFIRCISQKHDFLLFLIKLRRNRYATHKCLMKNKIKFRFNSCIFFPDIFLSMLF